MVSQREDEMISTARCLEGHALVDIKAIGTGLMRLPGIAIEAGVEVDVPFDKSRNNQRVAEIDSGRADRDLVTTVKHIWVGQ
jgi:hypothetical protein